MEDLVQRVFDAAHLTTQEQKECISAVYVLIKHGIALDPILYKDMQHPAIQALIILKEEQNSIAG